MPKYLIILFCAALLIPNLRAQPEFVTRHSFSKQFVIYGPKTAPIQRSHRVPLDPALLAVSCDRIKQTLLAELGGAGRWQLNLRGSDAGKIYVVIHPDSKQSILITPIRTTQTPSYRIDLPGEVEPAHLIEAVTQATLLELVNRHSLENFTQIPPWFAQGMAARVQSASPDTLILQRSSPVSTTKRRIDPSEKIRLELQAFEPLTFNELNWPEQLSKERSQHFEKCAQLFVHELLRLKKGDDCLRQFVDELPRHLNWQVAFLRAFQPHFQHLVDVEKWWGLRLVNLTGRDAAQRWSIEQSLEQIDGVVRIPVQIQSTNTWSGRSEITLQKIIADWDTVAQRPALTKVVNQFKVLRLRVHPELIQLIDHYCSTLESYLQNADNDGLLRRVFARENLDDSQQGIQGRLDSLEQQRLTLRRLKPSTREEAILSALEIAGQRNGSSAKQ